MGFWSTLGKVASFAAPIAAAPFTGGTSLVALGKVAGDIAGSAAKDRQETGLYNLQRDELRLRAHQQELENNARFPATFAKQAYAADVLGNFRGTAADILNASTPEELRKARAARGWEMNDETRGALQEWQRQAILHLLNPKPTPEISELPKASIWEKILGGVSLGANLAGAFKAPHGYLPTASAGKN